MRDLDPVEAAYLAGLVDGEGTIALTRRHARDKRQLVVSVSNTEIEILRWILVVCQAGKITRKKVASPRHAPGYTYSISNRQALRLCAQIQPFMRSYKRHRAALALDQYVKLTPRNGRYTAEVAQARESFEQAFLALKARVPSATPDREVGPFS